MRKDNQKNQIMGRMVTMLAAAFALLFFCVYFYLMGDTSTGYRFEYRMKDVVKKYSDFGRVVDVEDSFPIPGLMRTNVTASLRINQQGECIRYEDARRKSTRNMIPQGLCFAGDYIAVSAYDGKAVYNSVLYILDAVTKEYLTTVVLEDKNHVGGITYDGENLWVAKSGDNALSKISYDRLCRAVAAGEDSVSLDYDATYAISCEASFVTCYAGLLWVGVFERGNDSVSVLRGFSYEERQGVSGLYQQDELFLPELSNGAAIQNINGRVCLLVDSSYGRTKASLVHVYELHMEEDNFENAVCELKDELVFPPMVEEVEFYEDSVYFVFESAATKYSMNPFHRCKYPVDRVCAVNMDKLLPWTSGEYEQRQVVMEPVYREFYEELSYHVSTAMEAKGIPAYVRRKSENRVQMLYNPYTAKMLFHVMRDTNRIGNGYVVGVPSWNDTLSRNGYANLQSFRHDAVQIYGEVSAGVEIVTGIMRKSEYNSQEKFNILIGIKTEDINAAQWQCFPGGLTCKNGFLEGFYENSWLLYQRLLKLAFDVPEVEETENGRVIRYVKRQFSDILEEMKKEESRFTVTVTGAGFGGGIADILAGVILPQQGIFEGNCNCYTFGAFGVSEENNFKATNIFNIVNADDVFPQFAGTVLWGSTVTYHADDAFVERYYGRERRADFYEIAHSMGIYEGILDKIEENMDWYATYNTECPGTFYGTLSV
ncbi:MAG: hypothetical protein K2G89_09660, partial [Lachnospiraceae bacterium]|nr:hypothetical protein [Lachnospiraceae bacterium]